jgi:hypothetical protein
MRLGDRDFFMANFLGPGGKWFWILVFRRPASPPCHLTGTGVQTSNFQRETVRAIILKAGQPGRGSPRHEWGFSLIPRH